MRLEDANGWTCDYRIVGPDETDVEKGLISIDSPVARALMRKSEGDEVVVRRPKVESLFTIVKVWYELSVGPEG